jgi:hypothetical protein
VVAWGSSGCPRLPTKVDVTEDNTIEVTMAHLAPPPSVTCPMDLTPTTSVLLVPGGVNIVGQVKVRIVDGELSATVSLPPHNSG